MKRLLKRVGTLIVLAAIAGAFIYAFRPQPIAVDTAKPVRGPMQVTIDEEGETRIRNRFLVSAPVSGRVGRIELDPGDPVQANLTVIATFLPAEPTPLDSRTRAEAEARVGQAEAALGRAAASRSQTSEQLAFAEAQLERYENLLEDGLVPRENFETVRAQARALREAMNTAEFEVRNAERAVEVARATLVEAGDATPGARPITIRSPIDGVVLRRLRESEAVVPLGEPLVEIGDVRDIEIVADLLSADAVQTKTGDRVLIGEWGGGTTLEGTVRRIEPSGFTRLSALGVEEQRVNVIMDLLDAGDAALSLGDGYRVEVRIVIWESPDVLKVPTGSLFRTGDEWSAYAVVEGRAELRILRLGRRNLVEAEVLAGLEASDTLIMHPAEEIEPGVEVVER
jgi:HlyD family secretion protein